MIACARNDLNLPASNYAVIFPNQSSFTGAKRRYPAWLSVRSCAPKNARIAMSSSRKFMKFNVDGWLYVFVVPPRIETQFHPWNYDCDDETIAGRCESGLKNYELDWGTGFLRRMLFSVGSARWSGQARLRRRKDEEHGWFFTFVATLPAEQGSPRLLTPITILLFKPVVHPSCARTAPSLAYLRLQLMLSRGKHPSETSMTSSYSSKRFQSVNLFVARPRNFLRFRLSRRVIVSENQTVLLFARDYCYPLRTGSPSSIKLIMERRVCRRSEILPSLLHD